MYQNYNTYYQPKPYLKGRPVSSLEEARATTIDFDGSIFYFPDLANKRIYTKQINMDGTATINLYEFKESPNYVPSSLDESNYVSRKEFEAAIEKIEQALKENNKESEMVWDIK